VTSITLDGTTATVTCGSAHGREDGDPLLITGADQAAYNGFQQISYVSTTVFTYQVVGSPATPATGTITAVFLDQETYFKFTHAANLNGANLLLHETSGHLYQMLPTLYADAGVPINWFIRTVRMDGGTNDKKKLAALSLIGDKVSDTAMLRWSDDDSQTFSAYRVVDLNTERPRTRRCGAFRRRTVELRHVGNTAPQLQALELEIAQ
jgi:hypothetical protein